MVRGDAAIPDEAAGIRPPGVFDRRLDRFHARAEGRSGQARVAVQDRTALHAARGQQVGRSARHADAAIGRRRHQLGGRVGRSGDRHVVRRFSHHAHCGRIGSRRSGAERFWVRVGPGAESAAPPWGVGGGAGGCAGAAQVVAGVGAVPRAAPPKAAGAAASIFKDCHWSNHHGDASPRTT